MKSNHLKEARLQHGWSQAKLAEALEVDIRTVRRWEQGEAIPFPYYRHKLSTLFGKTTEELGLLPDSNGNNAMEEFSPFAAQSTLPNVPASASFVINPTIPQTVESTNGLQGHDSEVPAAQEPLINSDQPRPERRHVSGRYPFSFRFFWDVDIHMRLALPPRLSNQISLRRLALIGSPILLIVLVMAALLPAFHWRTPPSSTYTQNHFASPAHAQASAEPQTTGASFQNIYTQATSGTPLINDSLSAQSNASWDTYHHHDGRGCTFTDRTLRCSSRQGAYDPSPAQSNNFSNLANIAMEVSTTIIQGDRAAVLLRWHGHIESGYRFYFTNDGYYTFEFLDNGDEHVLVSQSSSAINIGTGQSNTITIIARKNTFYLYINKKYVNSVSDSSFSSGQIAVASDGKNTNSEVAFSNLRVWQS